MVEQPRRGCEGMESTRATHILHRGVRGAQTSGNVMNTGMEGACCKGGMPFVTQGNHCMDYLEM